MACLPKRITLFASVDPDQCNACTLHVSGIANGFAERGIKTALISPTMAEDSQMNLLLDPAVERVAFARPRIPGLRTVWSLGPLFALPHFFHAIRKESGSIVYLRSSGLTFLLALLARISGVACVGEHNGIICEELPPGRMSSKILQYPLLWAQN